MFKRTHYAILLAILIGMNLHYSPDLYLDDEDGFKLRTSENNADPTKESLISKHVADDSFTLPSNFTAVDFSITNTSEYLFFGHFNGALQLNPTNIIQSNSSSEDIMIIKTDFNGTITSYFHVGGDGDDRIKGMDIDPYGNIYVAGYMGANLTVGNTNYTTNDREGLVMKLDQNFSIIWSNNVTTHGNGNEISDVDWGSNDSIAIVGDCNGTKVGNVITSISFSTTVTYKRCGTSYKSDAALTYNQFPLGGLGTNMYVGKLNSTGDWQWAKKTEGNRNSQGGMSSAWQTSWDLDAESSNVWHDSNGDIIGQGKTKKTQDADVNWCDQGSNSGSKGLVFDDTLGIVNQCTPGIVMAKLSNSGNVKKLINLERGYYGPSSCTDCIGDEHVMDTDQFAFSLKSNFVDNQQGKTSSGGNAPEHCSTTSHAVYHISWMNESLCTRDGYTRYSGTGTVDSIVLSSGNQSEPQIIAAFKATGIITLGSIELILSSANTPVVAQINTSNASASATGYGWGWAVKLPSYAGYSIDSTEISSSGDIHVLLGNGIQTLLRVTGDSDGDGVGKYSDKFPNDSTQWNDFDNDGFGDAPTGNNPDGCVTQAGNSTWPVLGCPDYDTDGWSDARDRFPGEMSQWNDSDWDGYGDNTTGFQPDSCPNTYGASNRNATGAINGNGAVFGCLDTDFDGFSDIIDDCTNQYGDSVYGISNGNNISYIGCSDSDRDGYADIDDPCSLQYGSSWLDRLGCADTDGDGISDLRDPSPNSAINNTDDWDGDGYSDLRTWTNTDGLQYWINGTDVFPDDQYEWNDLDSDGVGDNSDQFPNLNSQYLDSDGDGYGDNSTGFEGDWCIFEWGNATSGTALGCLDSDGDGWADRDDAFDNDKSQWNDSDGDGWGDNPTGTNPDQFPNDSGEWFDSDGDGTGDNSDAFPLNANESADSDGDGVGDNTDQFDNDPLETIDSDGDGIGNNADACTFTYGNISTGNFVGCPDYDGDGYADVDDAFPDDLTQWSDSDGDGYGDNQSGNNPDLFVGLRSEWADFDGDGYGDNTQDKFPNEVTQWSDLDGDGYGDNESGNNSDAFRYDPTEWRDTDGDLVGDNADAFPNDSNETKDSDGDGFGDNSDECKNDRGDINDGPYKGCPDKDRDGYADSIDWDETNPNEWLDSDGDGVGDNTDQCEDQAGTIETLGCVDSDGDGWADIIDEYKSNSKAWSDGDGDNYTDQSGQPGLSDDCPNQFGNSLIGMLGCPDLDGDGLPDLLDPDIDGDGFENSVEFRYKSDSYNNISTPPDVDGDMISDNDDDDIDGDGFPNDLEKERDTDPTDPDDTPLSQAPGTYLSIDDGLSFSSSYSEEGIELSVLRLRDEVKTVAGAIISIVFSILTLRRKTRRYNRIRTELEHEQDHSSLDSIREKIDFLVEKGKIKIEQGLLLRNMFEQKEKDMYGLLNLNNEVTKSTEKELPKIKQTPTPPVAHEAPPKTATGTVGNDGYEYIKWPEDSQTQWYRPVDGKAEWNIWE